MKKTVAIVLAFFFLQASSCKKLCEDDTISIIKKENESSKLRTDGYYYHCDTDGRFIFDFFLYKNGILFRVTAVESTFEDYERKILAFDNIQRYYRNKKKFWGTYVIENDTIRYELYYPGSSCAMSTWIMEGIILNDSTFHILKSYKPNKSDLQKEDKIYHFKLYSPKPDSTNPYIK